MKISSMRFISFVLAVIMIFTCFMPYSVFASEITDEPDDTTGIEDVVIDTVDIDTQEPVIEIMTTEEPAVVEETPASTEEPVEETPLPTEEPVITPEPTEEPVVTPEPTEEPVETPEPTEEPEEEKEVIPSGVHIYVLKSDVQDGAEYVLRSASGDLSYSSAVGSYGASVMTVDTEGLVDWLPQYWTADGQKTMNSMLSDAIMGRLGVWNTSGRFVCYPFVLSQDGHDIAEYFLFIFKLDDSDDYGYLFAESNSMMDLNDINSLIGQYRYDSSDFGDSALSAYEYSVLRDVMRGSLEYRNSGIFGSEGWIDVYCYLNGPQYVEVIEEVEEEPEEPMPTEEPVETPEPTIGPTPEVTEEPVVTSEPTPEPITEPVEEMPEPEDTEVDMFVEEPNPTEEPEPTDGSDEEENEELSPDVLLSDEQLMMPTRDVLAVGLRSLGSSPLPVLQDPVTADGITIEKLTSRWLSVSTGESERAGFWTLNLVAGDNDLVPNQQWQIDFALSGKGTIPAGSIELVIPAYIWKDRNGNEPGLLTLAIPEEPESSNDFAWKRVGDCIVITNTHALSAAAKYMIQGTFRMTYPDPNADRPFNTAYAHDMVDKDVVNQVTEYGGVSDDFFAVLNIMTPRTEEILSMTSNSIHAELDTSVCVVSASKIAVDRKVYYDSIPSKLPSSMRPENPNDWVYVQWYLDGRAAGSQPFKMEFEDILNDTVYMYNATSKQWEPIEGHGKMLGATNTMSGIVLSEDGDSVSGVLYDGYSTSSKVCYVWTAYPKDTFEDENVTYKIENSDTITVTGYDDEVVSSRTASASVTFSFPKPTVPTDPVPLGPPVTWHIEKVWVDNDDEAGHRPSGQRFGWRRTNGSYVRETVLSDKNDWQTEWTDSSDYTYYAYEIGTPSGYEDWIEYDTGMKSRIHWWYTSSYVYDAETRTWVFTNQYHQSCEWSSIAQIEHSKRALNHTNSHTKATTDRDLQFLYNGLETTQISYRVDGSTFCLPFTTAEGGALWDTEALGGRYVSFELVDHDEYLDNRHLSNDEYRICSVRLETPIVSLWEPDGEGGQGHLVGADETIPVKLFGLTGDGDWIQYAILEDGVITPMNNAVVSGNLVEFPCAVNQVKAVVRTNAAHVKLGYELNVVLCSSADIKADLDAIFATTDYAMCRSTNYSTANLKDANDDLIVSVDKNAITYLHGRNYRIGADLQKTTTYVANNKSTRALVFSNTISLVQQSNIIDKSDYDAALNMNEFANSQSGTFYDLLPPGMTADVDSVTLDYGTIKTVDIIENYKGSGRQLLVVKADLGTHDVYSSSYYMGDSTTPDSGYGSRHTVTFQMYYGYDEALNFGLLNLYNHAAYEADEVALGNLRYWMGEPDNPDGGNHKHSNCFLDEESKSLMVDLNSANNNPSFVYASASTRVTEMDFSALTDIKKQVQVIGSDRWSYGHNNDVNVYEGGKYAYRIELTSGTDTTTKDIIILDSIENYVLQPDDADYADGRWYWHGAFQSIDVSAIRSMGVDVVVYYSTVDNLNLSGYNENHEIGVVTNILNNSGVWTTELPADPSLVKAIAIDCRYRTDGTEFELNENESLLAYVYMKAPTWQTTPDAFGETDYDNHLNNAHAYNDVFMDVTQIDDFDNITHSYDHFTYTKIGILSFDLDFQKEWDDANDNDRIRPSEVTVRLMANGEDAGYPELVLRAEDGWVGTIEHVRLYDDNGSRIYYTAEDEIEDYTCSSVMNEQTMVVRNTHELYKVEVPFEKFWTSNEPAGWESNIPASITVKLYADGEYTGQSRVVRRGLDGTWQGSFVGLLKYKDGEEIVYTVQEVPVEDFIMTQEGNTITNMYYPYADLSVAKHVQNGTSAALETAFTYSLSLYDSNGDPLTHQYQYQIVNADGEEVSVGEIGNGGEFSLHDGEVFYIFDIPSHSHYEVTENPSYGFTNISHENSSGTIITGKTAESVFVNYYASYGTAVVKASKELIGRDLARYQFKFSLLDSTGNVLRMASNDASGNVSFGAIRYNEANDGQTYVYYMYEVDAARSGYTYDNVWYKIEVTPRDNGNGTITCDIRYYKSVLPDAAEAEEPGESAEGGQVMPFVPAGLVWDDIQYEDVDAAEFHNEYHAEGTIIVRAWKVLEHRSLKDDEFLFQLIDEDGKVLQTVRNLSDGSVVFNEVTYDETDVGNTYYYAIREVSLYDPTVIYDESVYGYSVEVLDNGDGTLGFSQNTIDVSNMFVSCGTCSGNGYVDGGSVSYQASLSASRVFNISMTGLEGSWSLISWNSPKLNEGLVDFSGLSYQFTVPAELNGKVLTDEQMLQELSYGLTVFVTDEDGCVSYVNIPLEIPETEGSSTFTVDGTAVVMTPCADCLGSGFVKNSEYEAQEGELPVFRNKLRPGSLIIRKQITDVNAELVDPNQEFHFHVKLIGSDLEDGTVEYDLEQVPEDEPLPIEQP